jgi:hypothetical protein
MAVLSAQCWCAKAPKKGKQDASCSPIFNALRNESKQACHGSAQCSVLLVFEGTKKKESMTLPVHQSLG